MKRKLTDLLRDRAAGSAAEFALVLPLLLIFLLGIVDVGRLMWTWNQAEKATQMGVRYAVVTEPVPSGLSTFNFVGTGGLTQGDAILGTAYGGMACTNPTGTAANPVGSVTCACTGNCPWGTAADSGEDVPFNRIYKHMQRFLSPLQPKNLKVLYQPSGLGFAGNPHGPDISPVVTVELTGLIFKPVSLSLFGASVPLPSFSAALTMEDGQGSQSN
ncbi:hypothetical protein TomMM35A_06890 [Sphingobium sp. TomMM35A]